MSWSCLGLDTALSRCCLGLGWRGLDYNSAPVYLQYVTFTQTEAKIKPAMWNGLEKSKSSPDILYQGGWEFLQIWQKHPFGVKDEWIRFWWMDVNRKPDFCVEKRSFRIYHIKYFEKHDIAVALRYCTKTCCLLFMREKVKTLFLSLGDRGLV